MLCSQHKGAVQRIVCLQAACLCLLQDHLESRIYTDIKMISMGFGITKHRG